MVFVVNLNVQKLITLGEIIGSIYRFVVNEVLYKNVIFGHNICMSTSGQLFK